MIDLKTVGTVQVLTLSSGPVNAQDVELLEELTSAVGELPDTFGCRRVGRHRERPGVQRRGGPQPRGGGRRRLHRSAGPGAVRGVRGDVFLPGPDRGRDQRRRHRGRMRARVRLRPPPHRPRGADRGGRGARRGAVSGRRAGGHALRVRGPRRGSATGWPHLSGVQYVARGLAHRVVADDLLEAAVAEASDLGGIPADAYRQTKTQLRAPTTARIREAGRIDNEVRQMWGADETLQRIAAYVERLRRRD